MGGAGSRSLYLKADTVETQPAPSPREPRDRRPGPHRRTRPPARTRTPRLRGRYPAPPGNRSPPRPVPLPGVSLLSAFSPRRSARVPGPPVAPAPPPLGLPPPISTTDASFKGVIRFRVGVIEIFDEGFPHRLQILHVIRVFESRSQLGDDRLHADPRQQQLAIVLEQQFLIQHPRRDKRRDHIPITGDLAHERVAFGAGRADLPELGHALALEVRDKPVSGRAHLLLAPQLIQFQNQVHI